MAGLASTYPILVRGVRSTSSRIMRKSMAGSAAGAGALAHALDGRLGQHVPHLGARGALDLLADHAKEHVGQRLGALEEDVAHKAVADHHVGVAVEDVAPLDV